MKPSSQNRRNSRYVQGGSAERFTNRIGFWQRRKFPTHESDEIVTLDARYDRKPWLLAYDKYNDVELMWFILQYNAILDINTEFVIGAELRLPTATRLYMDLLSRNASSTNS